MSYKVLVGNSVPNLRQELAHRTSKISWVWWRCHPDQEIWNPHNEPHYNNLATDYTY